MSSYKPEFVSIGVDDVASEQPAGRFFFLPGSPGRARAIAERFEDRRSFAGARDHDVHLGRITCKGTSIDVGVVPTGMGCPSVDIIVTELIALGARALLRVGSAGSLAPDKVRAGHLVVATGAVRDEGASLSYAPAEYPAVASVDIVTAAERASEALGLGGVVHRGLVQTKDSLFGREFGFGPRGATNREYSRLLSRLGVLASEMEAAHVLILAQAYSASPVVPDAVLHPVHAGCILGVIGDEVNGLCDEAMIAATTERLIDTSFHTAVEFVRDYRAPHAA